MADQCGFLITESGSRITAEDGRGLVTECFVPSPDVTTLVPGKVWKGEYPYWRNRIPYKPPYSRPSPNYVEEEELLVLMSLED